MYDVLVFVHILSAMVWVGGGFVLIAVERHAYKVGGIQGLARTRAENEWVDDWIFTPAPLLVIATGIPMVIVNNAWAFSQPWIYLALGLIVAEFAIGYPELKRIEEAREKGVDTREFGKALQAYMRMAPVAIVMLATIVFLMVFKPGV